MTGVQTCALPILLQNCRRAVNMPPRHSQSSQTRQQNPDHESNRENSGQHQKDDRQPLFHYGPILSHRMHLKRRIAPVRLLPRLQKMARALARTPGFSALLEAFGPIRCGFDPASVDRSPVCQPKTWPGQDSASSSTPRTVEASNQSFLQLIGPTLLPS